MIVQGKDIDFNRKALENKKTTELILSHNQNKDMLYQRNSGLNQVLCKIAKKNDITLTIDFKELKGDKKEQAITLSRIMQNIKLIKKYKNKLKIKNLEKKQAEPLLLLFGLPTSMIKKVEY